MQAQRPPVDYINPFNFLKDSGTIGGDAIFNKDGSINLDVYIAYNYQRLGFSSNYEFRQELELEVRRCLLKQDVDALAKAMKMPLLTPEEAASTNDPEQA